MHVQFSSRRIKRAIVPTVALAAWAGMALVGLMQSNPFVVATETAAAHGRWPIEQVRFDRGHYRFFGLFSTVEAHVTASTDTSDTPARIRLTHMPLRGWETSAFEMQPPRRR